MRERKSTLIEITLLGLLGGLALLSLVGPQLFRDRAAPQLLSLSVLLRDTDSSGWTVARQGMEQAADEFGAELRFLTLSTHGDSDEQTELCLREIDGGARALVVVPADPSALHTALLPCKTPVVTLESGMEGAEGTAAPDNTLLGQQLAQALLEDWDGGTVLLLDIDPSCAGVADRIQAAQAALEEQGVPTRRASSLDWPPQERWVMAFDPLVTQQTAEQKEAGALSFALYGVGSSTAITALLERGTISALAAWNDYAAGYLAVRQAVQAVRGEGQPLSPLTFSILRGEDIYAPDNQKLLFPVTS